jgi:hypothetical protein
MKRFDALETFFTKHLADNDFSPLNVWSEQDLYIQPGEYVAHYLYNLTQKKELISFMREHYPEVVAEMENHCVDVMSTFCTLFTALRTGNEHDVGFYGYCAKRILPNEGDGRSYNQLTKQCQLWFFNNREKAKTVFEALEFKDALFDDAHVSEFVLLVSYSTYANNVIKLNHVWVCGP